MKKTNLLIVDDDIAVRKVMKKFFSSKGCFVETASNGLEALKKFNKYHFDYLITDIEMPEMDGVKLIETIRFDLKNRKLPIIVYSNNIDKIEKSKYKYLKINHTIQKPIFNLDNFFKYLHV